MASSPAHQFGQIIGDVLEAAVGEYLAKSAKQLGLFLDRHGPRKCRKGLKATWIDARGNAHDLDFVLERGGTAHRRGDPLAFIEVAWRRYTKHSRNKAQEIQGAIEPLAATYEQFHPFKGAFLAGVFTNGAIEQLRSLNFHIVYIRYADVVAEFAQFGIDAASSESTPDQEFLGKIASFQKLSSRERSSLGRRLLKTQAAELRHFGEMLSACVSRTIVQVVVTVLHGERIELDSIRGAIALVESYNGTEQTLPLVRYEIELRFSNGNVIAGRFIDRAHAVAFLQQHAYAAPPAY